MNTSRRIIALAILASASAVSAQNSVPGQRLPGLDDFSLPSSRPTPRAVPSAEPTIAPPPAVSATPERPVVPSVVATPAPRVTPAPSATRTPAPRVTAPPEPRAAATPIAPIAAPTPEAVAPLPALTPLPQPVPSPRATAVAPAPPAEPGSSWIWFAGAGVLALLVAGALFAWSRKRPSVEEVEPDYVERGDESFAPDFATVPDIAPSPVAPPVVAVAQPRATLVIELTPKRAGTNLLSAAVEYRLVLRNVGDLPARDVRLDVRLLSTGRQHDAAIAALFAAPIAKPIAAPFELAPGSLVELNGMALHPKDTLEVMTAGERVLFVPMLTVDVRYAWSGGEGQASGSYVIGIDRGADAKLAPFRLDAAARMYDTLAVLPYTGSVTR